jgi:hypothetical protein
VHAAEAEGEADQRWGGIRDDRGNADRMESTDAEATGLDDEDEDEADLDDAEDIV